MPSDSISESADFQNFLGSMPPDFPSFGILRMHVCFTHNEHTSPLKMPDHLCKGCSSPELYCDHLNPQECINTYTTKDILTGT